MVNASAVFFGDLSRARLALGASGVRRSRSTPGALGPLTVGTNSTYWPTAEAPGSGGVCADAEPTMIPATIVTATEVTTWAHRTWAHRNSPDVLTRAFGTGR